MKYLVLHRFKPKPASPDEITKYGDEIFVDLYDKLEIANENAIKFKTIPHYDIEILELEDEVINAKNATLHQPGARFGEGNFRLRLTSEIETLKQIKNGEKDLSVLKPYSPKKRKRQEHESEQQQQDLTPKQETKTEKIRANISQPYSYTQSRTAFFLGFHPRLGKGNHGSPLLEIKRRAPHFDPWAFNLPVNLAIPRDPAKKAAGILDKLIRQKYNVLYTRVIFPTPLTINFVFNKDNLIQDRRIEASKAIDLLTSIGGIKTDILFTQEVAVILTLEQCNTAIKLLKLLTTPSVEETAANNASRSLSTGGAGGRGLALC